MGAAIAIIPTNLRNPRRRLWGAWTRLRKCTGRWTVDDTEEGQYAAPLPRGEYHRIEFLMRSTPLILLRHLSDGSR